MPTTYPTEPQVLSGGVVDWPAFARSENGRHLLVPLTCGICGRTRLLQAAGVLKDIARGKLTGRCNHCAPLLKREAALKRYRARGREEHEDGVVIDWTTTERILDGHGPWAVVVVCRCGYTRQVPFGARDTKHLCGLCRQCARVDASADLLNGQWKGATYPHAQGYRIVRIPPNHPMIGMAEVKTQSGWGVVLEHRLVKAMELGRPLESWEQVHHKDKNKLNNDLANLVTVTPDEHGVITMMEREIAKLRARVTELRATTRAP